jgi:large subunit ribosomal protein L21
MKAVFTTGGKQYTVCEGDEVFVEKLNVGVGETVTFDKILFLGDGDSVKFGTPYVEGAKVEAKVVKNGKGKKLNIVTYKPKKGSARRLGHRQPYTKLTVTNITE